MTTISTANFLFFSFLINSIFLFLLLQIETLPPELFDCKKLQSLYLGKNCLLSLPSSINKLTLLTELELRGNLLERLPVELGECCLLKRSGLLVEENLFNMLPSEIREQILDS